MIMKISDPLLPQLSDFIAAHLGLHFPRQRWPELQRAVESAAQECGCGRDLDAYVQGVLLSAASDHHLGLLASHLTVGETYFFREKRSLQILEERIVPDLVRARAGSGVPIRIWSAGCATGEEPYSVAIALNRLLADAPDPNVEILATDLNAKSLQKASAGTYGDWSFRDTALRLRRTYFEAAEGGRCTIVPAIRKMVRFAPLNLMDDAYPPLSNWTGGCDVIFCRNVLMYFTPQGMNKVIRRLYQSLATDGWLIVSPTEASCELFSEFATVSFGDATFYRKSDHRKSATCLPTIHFSPLLDDTTPVVPSPEWTARASEPAQISFDEADQKTPEEETRSKNAAPVPVYDQALALYEGKLYEDLERTILALPSSEGNRAPAIFLLARAYANQGKLALALHWCDRAIAADKMTARAYYLRAIILQEQGSVAEAAFAFKQTVYVEPQFVLGHFSLGKLALNHGKPGESEKHFENVRLLLSHYEPEDIVPESGGLTAGRLREMIVSERGGVAPNGTGAALSRRTFHRAGELRVEQAGTR